MSVYRDPNIPIEVTVGETFTFPLKSVPSTGYTWQAEYDPDMIDLLGPPMLVPCPSTVGGGGDEVFEFQTKQVGDTQIKMKYQREWEKTPREIKLFRVHITQ